MRPKSAPLPAQAAPHLLLEPTHHDFGKLAPDTVASHRFKLTNTGGANLFIFRVEPSCGCTSTVLGQGALAPGESTDVEVRFNTAGWKGPVQKSVRVVSNDPAEPNQTLSFDADVQADFTVSAEEVAMRDLGRKDRRKASVKIVSNTGKAVLVENVELSPAPWLGVATREVGTNLFVDFDLHARLLPPGQSTGVDTIAVHILNPRAAVINLKVRWQRLAR